MALAAAKVVVGVYSIRGRGCWYVVEERAWLWVCTVLTEKEGVDVGVYSVSGRGRIFWCVQC